MVGQVLPRHSEENICRPYTHGIIFPTPPGRSRALRPMSLRVCGTAPRLSMRLPARPRSAARREKKEHQDHSAEHRNDLQSLERPGRPRARSRRAGERERIPFGAAPGPGRGTPDLEALYLSPPWRCRFATRLRHGPILSLACLSQACHSRLWVRVGGLMMKRMRCMLSSGGGRARFVGHTIDKLTRFTLHLRVSTIGMACLNAPCL
jgi:hypothetical protein